MKILSRFVFFASALFIFTLISASAQRVKVPADLEITLQRTMCFGTCPDYTLTIKANRRVTFKGGQFTRVKGTASGRITRSSLRELVRAFDQADLTSFADDYSPSGGVCEGYMTDVPSEIISIRRNGKTKRVNHYFGCMGTAVNEKLKPLVALGKTIDRVTNSKRWVVK